MLEAAIPYIALGIPAIWAVYGAWLIYQICYGPDKWTRFPWTRR